MKRLAPALPLSLLLACSPAEPVTAPEATMPQPPLAAAIPADTAAAAASTTTPLAVDAVAPDFTVDAWQAGEPFRFTLSEALQQGPVVVYFFPAAFTAGCNLEARLFSESIDAFAAHNARVIGVTAGNADQLAEFSNDNETCAGKFPVAADPGARVAAQYGAVLEARPEWSSRTSFAIRQDGTIARVHADMKPQEHVKQMLAALDG